MRYSKCLQIAQAELSKPTERCTELADIHQQPLGDIIHSDWFKNCMALDIQAEAIVLGIK